MRIRYWLVLAFVLFSPLASFAQTPQLAGVGANPTAANSQNGYSPDVSKVSEPSIVPPFPGAVISGYHYWPFNTVPILISPIARGASASTTTTGTKTVKGAYTILLYDTPPNTPEVAAQQYYEAAIQKAGGGIAYSCDNAACGVNGMSVSDACLSVGKWYYPDQYESLLAAQGSDTGQFGFDQGPNMNLTECHYFVGYVPTAGADGDIYVAVLVYNNTNGNGSTGSTVFTLVNVIEASNFAVKTVHLDADKMASDITATGKVDIYGIYFDTDQYVIKPASQDALQQIAKLLTNEPTLHVLIVGHTDSQGDYDHNITLSQNRANAVVQALVSTYHIDPSRLKPVGDGMTAPVATNDTDAGRALNRRVKLVKD